MKLMRVAKLVREVIFKTNYHFSGSLCDDQYNWLPTSLAALVRIILCDSNTKQTIYGLEISPAATSQLLVFSAIKQSSADSLAVRHNLDRETSSIVSRPAHPQQNTQTGSQWQLILEKTVSVIWQSFATLYGRSQYSNWQIWEWRLCLLCDPNRQTVQHWKPWQYRSQSLIYIESITTLQYPSQSMSQMINGVVRVFPVISDDNETTERGASNVTKGSHITSGRIK